MLANQLRNGDLIIGTANNNDAQVLRRHRSDWAHQIGERATVLVPQCGMILQGIARTPWNWSDEPVISRAETTYMRCLVRNDTKNPTPSITTGFGRVRRPEDTNKIIGY